MNFPCLDIIIPHYRESVDMINHLLSSIDNQVGIDLQKVIRVTIVNDCDNEAYEALNRAQLNKRYKYSLTIMQTPLNGGAGYARQYGLDRTELPYIMFCDSDDSLWDCSALMKLLNQIRVLEIQEKPWSYIWSDFYEERFLNNRGYDLFSHDKPSMIWLHGKVWNRQFLNEHNIRFHNKLRTFEDTYFGKIVGLSAPKSYAYHLPYPTYLWRRNPNSITSQWNVDDRSYLYWRYKDYINCNFDTLDFIYKAKTLEHSRWKEVYLTTLYFTYFILQLTEYNDIENPETQLRRKAIQDMFVELITRWGTTVQANYKELCDWYTEVRSNMANLFQGFGIEQEPYNNFLDRLSKEYNVNLEDYKLDWTKNK